MGGTYGFIAQPRGQDIAGYKASFDKSETAVQAPH